MCKMTRLTPEQYRVLLKRITAALDNAKYKPATVGGWDGPALAAEEVLRPYAPLPKDS
jgi:hypothetical protein